MFLNYCIFKLRIIMSKTKLTAEKSRRSIRHCKKYEVRRKKVKLLKEKQSEFTLVVFQASKNVSFK